jgi:hypothetical protein
MRSHTLTAFKAGPRKGRSRLLWAEGQDQLGWADLFDAERGAAGRRRESRIRHDAGSNSGLDWTPHRAPQAPAKASVLRAQPDGNPTDTQRPEPCHVDLAASRSLIADVNAYR